MVKIDDLLNFAPYLSIVHHTKGRVRLRASSKIQNVQGVGVDFLYDLPKHIQGIKTIKLNKLIGSITISYDEDVFKPSLWEELLKGNVSDELKEDLNALLNAKGGKNGK